MKELIGYNKTLEKLLKRFNDSSDGLFLSVDDESKLKQLVLEIIDALDSAFGEGNKYSNSVLHTYNTKIGGFGPGPTYQCVTDLIAIVKASITKIGNEKQYMTKSNSKDIWNNISNDFGINKLAFGRKINFVSDTYKRKIIFRDVANAYYLAYNGFHKSSVILAGSVIEELLRLYLIYKDIKPENKKFYAYIKACEINGLLVKGISQLSDSARHFRNIVHLSNENKKSNSMEKTNAINAVSSIFIIANDF